MDANQARIFYSTIHFTICSSDQRNATFTVINGVLKTSCTPCYPHFLFTKVDDHYSLHSAVHILSVPFNGCDLSMPTTFARTCQVSYGFWWLFFGRPAYKSSRLDTFSNVRQVRRKPHDHARHASLAVKLRL